MQYFHLRIEQARGGVKARVGGMYRDDILFSLLPEGERCMALIVPSAAAVRVLRLKEVAEKLEENIYSVTGTEGIADIFRSFGPGRFLSQEPLHFIIFEGERPPAKVNPASPEGAFAVVRFGSDRSGTVEVPGASRLRPMVVRALRKLLTPHLKKNQRAKLREEGDGIFTRAADGVIATAALNGITVNNFPGPDPGLCKLWFVTGEELTLSRRTELTRNPPVSMQIGEITLTDDWTVQFREEGAATPELFAAYLRIGVGSAKVACGCVSFLVSGALGIIPAAIFGGWWWLLPPVCAGAAIVFSIGSALVIRARRKALNRIRRGKYL